MKIDDDDIEEVRITQKSNKTEESLFGNRPSRKFLEESPRGDSGIFLTEHNERTQHIPKSLSQRKLIEVIGEDEEKMPSSNNKKGVIEVIETEKGDVEDLTDRKDYLEEALRLGNSSFGEGRSEDILEQVSRLTDIDSEYSHGKSEHSQGICGFSRATSAVAVPFDKEQIQGSMIIPGGRVIDESTRKRIWDAAENVGSTLNREPTVHALGVGWSINRVQGESMNEDTRETDLDTSKEESTIFHTRKIHFGTGNTCSSNTCQMNQHPLIQEANLEELD